MKLQLAILTADRSEYKGQVLPDGRPQGKNYVLDLLANLEQIGTLDRKDLQPIPVIVGTSETKFLGKWKDDPRLNVIPMTEAKAQAWNLPALKPVRRCALNYLMCWRYCVEKRDWDRLLVLEDDVTVAEGWYEYLLPILKDVDKKLPIPPLVTAYRPVDRLMGMYVKQGYTWFPVLHPTHHWGMQAFVYHRKHFFDSAALYSAVAAEVINTAGPEEILERVFWRHIQKLKSPSQAKYQVEMVATCPCLVQHHGTQSLVGCGVHQALHFLGDTVRVVDAGTGPVEIALPVLERPNESFYVRRLDRTDNKLTVLLDKEGKNKAHVEGQRTAEFKYVPPSEENPNATAKPREQKPKKVKRLHTRILNEEK